MEYNSCKQRQLSVSNGTKTVLINRYYRLCVNTCGFKMNQNHFKIPLKITNRGNCLDTPCYL